MALKFGLKAFLRNEGVRAVLCWIGAQYIRLCRRTGRWSTVGGHIPRRLWDEGQPFILCFWHGRLMMMPYCWDYGWPLHTLTSDHPDGRLIARTTAHFGLRTVVGSSSRGGAAALRRMARLIRDGSSIGLTPDGPRGPRMRAQSGAVALARLSGAPMVPVSFSAGRRRVLATWDRFVLALPFNRGAFVWGPPIRVPRDADAGTLEVCRAQLETALNDITREADGLVCAVPVTPAPLPAENA